MDDSRNALWAKLFLFSTTRCGVRIRARPQGWQGQGGGKGKGKPMGKAGVGAGGRFEDKSTSPPK